MLEGSRVVVVVPAFHEELHIGRVVETMPAFVDDILVVDDGSTDRTGTVALETGDERVHVEPHPRPRGVGAALTTGYQMALRRTQRPTDAICVMAGDGQMDPDDLERVALPVVRGEADYVKGDRFGDPTVRQSMGLPRWIGGQVFTRLTSAAIGQRISDSQCGYTALSRGAALRVDLDGLWPGFGYPNDLLGQLKALDLRVAEVPVRPVYGDEVSKLRLRHLPPIFYLIARAAVRRRLGMSPQRTT
ncbi:MAG TPA: glycosyltransferase family 2 protein [Labilithrix sp.]|nr:glycosyltransferase family 2 protein [Labilithrix sp.]